MINIQQLILEQLSPSTRLQSMINSDDLGLRRAAAKSRYLDPSDIDKLIDDPDYEIKSHLAEHPYLEPRHIDTLITDPDKHVREKIAEHPRLTSEHMWTLISDPSSDVRKRVAYHHKLGKDHIHALLDDPSWSVRDEVLENENMGPSHFDYLLSGNYSFADDHAVMHSVSKRVNLLPRHIDHIIDNDLNYGTAVSRVLNNHVLLPHQLTKVFDRWGETLEAHTELAAKLALHPGVPKQYLDRLVDHPSVQIRTNVSMRSDLTPDQVEKLRIDRDHIIRKNVEQKYPSR